MSGRALRPRGLGRAAVAVSGWNTVSRLTGFVRVLAVGAALGTTFLGNTYQSSNLVSNLLFELLAAGILSAPLVAPFVALFHRGRTEEVERLAGTLLGLSVAILGALALVLAVAGHQVMRVLTAGVDDPAVRAAEIRLGAFFLWFFLPQVVLYAVGAVASAVLNARQQFAAAAFAPVANNVVVTATMVAFMVLDRKSVV
jgi:putative peptidoglycan lipid II flippase